LVDQTFHWRQKITDSEVRTNTRAVEHALAQQRLEGLTVPADTVADLHRVASGEITSGELLRKLNARYIRRPNAKILEP
jgi:hypothetical protein